jgi:hypothetical protein
MPKGSIKTCYERATRGLVKSYYLQKLTRANVARALDDAVVGSEREKASSATKWLPLGSQFPSSRQRCQINLNGVCRF